MPGPVPGENPHPGLRQFSWGGGSPHLDLSRVADSTDFGITFGITGHEKEPFGPRNGITGGISVFYPMAESMGR